MSILLRYNAKRTENPCVGGSIPPRPPEDTKLAVMQAFLFVGSFVLRVHKCADSTYQ